MIVIGVDTHKRSHTLVALDARTGAERGRLTIPASADGTLEALRFAAALDSERVWTVEDCRHVSGRLERELLASGDRVVRVAPGLTESSRRAARQPGKSDPIDRDRDRPLRCAKGSTRSRSRSWTSRDQHGRGCTHGTKRVSDFPVRLQQEVHEPMSDGCRQIVLIRAAADLDAGAWVGGGGVKVYLPKMTLIGVPNGRLLPE